MEELEVHGQRGFVIANTGRHRFAWRSDGLVIDSSAWRFFRLKPYGPPEENGEGKKWLWIKSQNNSDDGVIMFQVCCFCLDKIFRLTTAKDSIHQGNPTPKPKETKQVEDFTRAVQMCLEQAFKSKRLAMVFRFVADQSIGVHSTDFV